MRDAAVNEWGDQPNYTILAAAKRTDRTVRSIERWVRNGLKCRKVAGIIVIEQNDLMDYWRARMISFPVGKTRRTD